MIKKFTVPLFALFFSLILSAAVVVKAQGQQSQPDSAGRRQMQPSQNNDQQPANRPNLLQLLNLSPDQIQQMRAINQEMRETVRAANMRLRQARRALDTAVYADTPNQAEVDQRVRALTNAQAEAIKLRADVEFRIRQILTPDQLIRFRDLRRQFEQKVRRQLLFQQKGLRQMNNKPV
ncbi:MAG: periplasmic heavy metal sensor [Pyrinomonadaceae bacterium]